MARRHRSRGRILLGLFTAGWCLAFVSCVRRDPFEDRYFRTLPVLEAPPPVRVAIVRKAPSVEVGCAGGYRLRAMPGPVTLEEGRGLPPGAVSARGDRIVWRGEPLPAGEVFLTPDDPWLGTVTVGKTAYRGELRILVEQPGTVTVVNHVDIEEYLAGVLGSEVPLDWPIEALKAQAVAARSYALYRIRSQTGLAPFDLTAGTDSQVYGGSRDKLSGPARAKLRTVAQETRGLVLTFGRKLFQVNYHAVCGGHTDPAWLLVGGDETTPLRGVPCGYCQVAAGREPRVAARYRWSFRIEEPELRKRLAALPGWDAGPGEAVTAIEPIPVGPGGHAGIARVTAGGRAIPVEMPKLRGAVGWEHLLSSAFEARRLGTLFVFEGKGWGHGGGMCQWGTWAMAQEGFSAEEILAYYYPGSALDRIY